MQCSRCMHSAGETHRSPSSFRCMETGAVDWRVQEESAAATAGVMGAVGVTEATTVVVVPAVAAKAVAMMEVAGKGVAAALEGRAGRLVAKGAEQGNAHK